MHTDYCFLQTKDADSIALFVKKCENDVIDVPMIMSCGSECGSGCRCGPNCMCTVDNLCHPRCTCAYKKSSCCCK